MADVFTGVILYMYNKLELNFVHTFNNLAFKRASKKDDEK